MIEQKRMIDLLKVLFFHSSFTSTNTERFPSLRGGNVIVVTLTKFEGNQSFGFRFETRGTLNT